MQGGVLVVSFSDDFVLDDQKVVIFDVKRVDMSQIVRFLLLYFVLELRDHTLQLRLLIVVLLLDRVQFFLKMVQFLH